MVVLELEQIEVDHCFACHGLWLDAGELELLIDKAGGDSASMGDVLALDGPVPHDDSLRRCPRCNSKMKQPTIEAGGKQVEIDICPQGHGIWLDDGELKTLIDSAGGTGASATIAEFLGDLLNEETD